MDTTDECKESHGKAPNVQRESFPYSVHTITFRKIKAGAFGNTVEIKTDSFGNTALLN